MDTQTFKYEIGQEVYAIVKYTGNYESKTIIIKGKIYCRTLDRYESKDKTKDSVSIHYGIEYKYKKDNSSATISESDISKYLNDMKEILYKKTEVYL